MRRARLVLLLLLVPATLRAGAAPRPPSSGPATAEGPDVFVGYSYTHAGEAGLNGWEASGSYAVGRSLRLVVDVDGHYGSFAQADLAQATLLAGGRRAWTIGSFTPFAEALLGGARTRTTVPLPGGEARATDWDWGVAAGGGLDYPVGGRWSARARFDLLLLRGEGQWDANPRLAIGVAYRFGS